MCLLPVSEVSSATFFTENNSKYDHTPTTWQTLCQAFPFCHLISSQSLPYDVILLLYRLARAQSYLRSALLYLLIGSTECFPYSRHGVAHLGTLHFYRRVYEWMLRFLLANEETEASTW